MNEIIGVILFLLIGIPLLSIGMILYAKYILDPILKWVFDRI